MAVNDLEIEIKVKVEDMRPLIDFLDKNGRFHSEEREVDEYFNPSHRDFLAVRPISEWLRLRSRKGRFFVNYKDWHYDSEDKASSCDEFETAVADIDQIKKLFGTLGIRPLVTVDKTRRKWLYDDYEISVDEVVGLGSFVEIEFKGQPAGKDPKDITDGMIGFLKRLNVGRIQRNYQGYPFLRLFPEEAEYHDE